MIKINELRKMVEEHIGHSHFAVHKYTLKHDNKRGYSVVVFGYTEEENKNLMGLIAKGLRVSLVNDEVKKGFLAGKPLGFRSYEIY